MVEIKLDNPTPKQREAMNAKTRYVAFGGARGGGKSHMVRQKAVLMALKHPGIRILIIRRTYKELLDNHIEPLLDLIKDDDLYNASEKRFKLPNRSKIIFGYCDKENDVRQYQGKEYDVIFIDEATQMTEHQLLVLGASCRGTNNFPKRIYYTCNPGGPGHEYIKRLFVDREFKSEENPNDYTFIQSLVFDNKALMEKDPDYIKNLQVLPEKLKRAWMYGEWDIFEGQFFEEFRKSPDPKLCEEAGISTEEALRRRMYTHVIEPFRIPATWEIARSFDWGYSKPFSCDWWAIDYDGRAYLIAQYYGCKGDPDEGLKLPPPQVFQEIARIEREHPDLKGRSIYGVADPAIWDSSTGPSVAEQGEAAGIYFAKGDHTRIPGWMQVHYRMAFDETGKPRIYFFNTCKHAIRTIPLLMYSETQTEDLDTSMEDHFADSMRYFCMSRPIKPVRETPKPVRGYSPLDL